MPSSLWGRAVRPVRRAWHRRFPTGTQISLLVAVAAELAALLALLKALVLQARVEPVVLKMAEQGA